MEDTKIINNVVRLENIKALKAIELKQELESNGLVLNTDFEWRWHSPASTEISYVEFTFKNPSYATYYKLRWE